MSRVTRHVCSHEDGARCRGDLASFSWSVPAAWRAATVFSLLGALLAVLALLVWAASCCAATRPLFRVAGLLQVSAAAARWGGSCRRSIGFNNHCEEIGTLTIKS